MAKKEVKALPNRIKHIAKEGFKNVTIFCTEGKIVLSEASEKELKHVYENVKDGTLYVQIVKA